MRVPHGESPSADLLLRLKKGVYITSSKDTRRFTASAKPIRLTWSGWLPSMKSPIPARSRSARGFLSLGHRGFWRLTLSIDDVVEESDETGRRKRRKEPDSSGQWTAPQTPPLRRSSRERAAGIGYRLSPRVHPSKRQVPVK